MITLKDVRKCYKSNVALNNFSLSIFDNEVFALLGLNGAGKSTLINIICTLIKKDSGSVIINDLDLDSSVNEIKQIIGLAPQENAIASNLTVRENLAFVADLYGVSLDRVEKVISALKLDNKRNERAKRLSGGQKRRLNLGLALIGEPKVLILDEPTLGLDVKARKELWEIVNNYKKNHTVLFTTHYLEEAEQFADRIAIVCKGELVVCGTKDEIIKFAKTTTFEDAFLKLAGGEDE